MSVADYAFYLFALTTVTGGFFTVMARNPVHSVLWLITAFVGATGLFVLLGAEFVAMLLMIVYVGAVAVLFLFVVMMLDVDFAELKAETRPIAAAGVADWCDPSDGTGHHLWHLAFRRWRRGRAPVDHPGDH